MKEFLTIKEFSKLSGIEQTTLRYWDDIGLFSPSKRNPENNYRYYTPQQIIAVNFITVLSEMNIPLKTIGRLEQMRTPDSILDLIDRQEMRIDMEMRRLRECYSIMHARRELITYGLRLGNGFRVIDGLRVDPDVVVDGGTWVDENEVAVLFRSEKAYIFGPPNEWKSGEPFYECFMRFCNAADDLRVNLSFPIGAYHENIESFVNAPGEPDRFISIDPTGNRIRSAGKYLTGFIRGYYGEFGDLPERMMAYAKEHKITLTGPVYTIYLLDEVCTSDPANYLSQVSIEVSEGRQGR